MNKDKKADLWFTLIPGMRFYFKTKEETERLMAAMRSCIKVLDDETMIQLWPRGSKTRVKL